MISTKLQNKQIQSLIKIGKKIGVALFWVLLWAVAAWWVDSSLVLPSPLDTLKGIITLSGDFKFFVSIGVTLLRVFGGVTISVALGLVLGLIGGLNKPFYEIMNPFVSIIKSLPVVSVIILINLWIASGVVPLVVTFLICFPVTWTNVVQGVHATDDNLLQMAKVYNVSQQRIIRDIYIPAVKPYAVSALMNAIGLGWKVTVTAEVLANALPSVGMNLYYSKIYLETDLLFSWTFVIVMCSYIIEKVTLYIIERNKRKGADQCQLS
ncbi:ABC transporter permease [Acetobacterium tundrae]|uniref:ABC transporter permease subunit n=1 Tax=Acetobacterium tundrae TaxID=132932 RepID=A0ABR6WL25_9FIRM|nr:ABC transporter permease subunit [Acetobacterium tundrae]MBC3797208.1 ABC transporter permease subunit [Acetobacterium tundrae]